MITRAWKLFRKALSKKSDTRHLADFFEEEAYESGFSEFYREHLAKHLIRAEETRVIYSYWVARRILIMFILCVSGLGATLYYAFDNGWHALLMAIFVFLFSLKWCFFPARAYSHNMKQEVFQSIFRYLGDFDFSANTPSNIDKFNGSDILPKFKSYTTEDHIKGVYRKVKFEMEEVSLLSRAYPQKGREVYRGLLFLIDCPKPFRGKTVVTSSHRKALPAFHSKFDNLSRVYLKNPQVEAEYHVYTTNKEEAGYLLINAFIERISALGDVFSKYNTEKRRRVECSFFDQKLMIALECRRNLFEVGSVFSPVSKEDLRLILAQVFWLFKVIDTLFHKLDKKSLPKK
jgi:hypothetical protein